MSKAKIEINDLRQLTTDTLSIGKYTAAGVGGVALDASGARVANMGAPTASGDAATLAAMRASATVATRSARNALPGLVAGMSVYVAADGILWLLRPDLITWRALVDYGTVAGDKTVYVNDTGNDTTGVGSQGAPYLTPERAALDLPYWSFGVRYWVDVTGLHLSRSQGWELPQIVSTVPADVTVSEINPNTGWTIAQALNVIATPTLTDTLDCTTVDYVDPSYFNAANIHGKVNVSQTLTPSAYQGGYLATTTSVAATGNVTITNALSVYNNNGFVTVGDGTHAPLVFEYQTDGSYVPTPGAVTVDISGVTGSFGVQKKAIRDLTLTAIQAQHGPAFQVTASANGNFAIDLVNDVAGAAGNVDIVTSTSASVSGMSGGTSPDILQIVDNDASSVTVAGAFTLSPDGAQVQIYLPGASLTISDDVATEGVIKAGGAGSVGLFGLKLTNSSANGSSDIRPSNALLLRGGDTRLRADNCAFSGAIKITSTLPVDFAKCLCGPTFSLYAGETGNTAFVRPELTANAAGGVTFADCALVNFNQLGNHGYLSRLGPRTDFTRCYGTGWYGDTEDWLTGEIRWTDCRIDNSIAGTYSALVSHGPGSNVTVDGGVFYGTVECFGDADLNLLKGKVSAPTGSGVVTALVVGRNGAGNRSDPGRTVVADSGALIENVDTPASDLHVSGISYAFTDLVARGVLTLGSGTYARMASAAAPVVTGLPVFADATRPAATDVPIGFGIYNTDDNAPNYSDGTAWRDAMGTVT